VSGDPALPQRGAERAPVRGCETDGLTMAERLPTAPPRGMRDVLPDEVELRDAATQEIVRVYRSHGFRRIETPALESLRLLVGSEGGENEKLIFKVMKRGDDLEAALARGGELADLGLRFDLTVPLARYYAENHGRLPDPLKAIQIGPVWRAERPQKGRYRQFTQCDIDVLGVAGIVSEVELMLATCEALARLGLTGLAVRVNDRQILALIARHCGFADDRQPGFFIAFDKLDKIGAEGVLGELREAGHDPAAVARFETLLPVLQKREMSLDALRAAVPAPGDGAAAFDRLAAILGLVAPELPEGARAHFDPTLVRGMGYYTGTIFEIVSPAFPSSIAGGGRYDRMIGRLLGRDVPACGFSIGFERLIAILGERGRPGDAAEPRAVAAPRRIALLVDDETALARALRAACALRAQGDLVSLELRRKNTRKQLDDLHAHGFSDQAVLETGTSAAVVKPLRRAG
jgi:histidyl-tRNA synthetase